MRMINMARTLTMVFDPSPSSSVGVCHRSYFRSPLPFLYCLLCRT